MDGAFPWLELMSPEEADVRSALNSLSRAYPTNTMFRKRMQSTHDRASTNVRVRAMLGGADPGFEKGGGGTVAKMRKLMIFMTRLINARSTFYGK